MNSTGRFLALGWLLISPACAAVQEPNGFRMDHYRGEVPATLQGGLVMHTPELAEMIGREHPLLIDVLPAPTPPADTRPELPRMVLPHRDLPGSLWWPDVGRGALDANFESRFRAHLVRVTGGKMTLPIVFYCQPQCWMSWNAAKRAIQYGYTRVIWYPEGADGWAADGHGTNVAKPGF